MLKSDPVQENLAKLVLFGYKIGDTEEGILACGSVGKGKLLETKKNN